MLTKNEVQPRFDTEPRCGGIRTNPQPVTWPYRTKPSKLTRSEIKSHLASEPRFDDIMCSLRATSKQPLLCTSFGCTG